MSDSEDIVQVYMNRPQMLADAVDAQHEIDVWARGTGKSDGRISMRTSKCVKAMPQGMGAMVARSFQQILTRTLPATVRGLGRLHLVYGKDFTVRERGPKSWPVPLMPPLKWDTAVHFRNGTALALISQQNPGSANGLSIDFAVGDEAKYLKREQYQEEFLPAIRGNRDRFGSLSYWQSTLLTTDMPTTPESRWILDKEDEMDPKLIEVILAHQLDISSMRSAINSGKLSEASVKVYDSKIRRKQALINELRKGTIYFSMASALDNIDVLGKGYLVRMKQTLPDYLFRTSILNMRPDRVEGGFYPDLSEEHTYIPDESSFVNNAGTDFFLGKEEFTDCRKDDDLVRGIPLDIGPDFGASINCLAIGQLFDMDFSVLNQIFVKHPKKIAHMAKAFHEYYQWHTPKHVILHYDHTMVGEDASREYGFAIELKRELEARGWTVTMHYVGQAPSHHSKYVFWGRRFSHADAHLPRVRFNSLNCEPLLLSMRLAGARQTRLGFEKDKKDEKNKSADQAETTHLSDACDLLVMAKFKSLGSSISGDSVGVHFG